MALSKKPVTGMKDILPEEMKIRNYVQNVIKDTYKAFGFTQIETPCVENISNLTNKQGGENEKLIFKILNPLYALSLLVVFLCLAALYESWTIPISIILVVPTGVLGALAMTALLGGHNDVYFQVGMLTTIGLVSKNAILIVEFAKMLYDAGEDLITASLDAVKLRFRPIVMTSLAFGLGVVPLVLAHGAGAGAQNAIGMAVLGGIITGTILCVGFVPMFYVVVNRLFRTRRRQLPEDVKENVQEK